MVPTFCQTRHATQQNCCQNKDPVHLTSKPFDLTEILLGIPEIFHMFHLESSSLRMSVDMDCPAGKVKSYLRLPFDNLGVESNPTSQAFYNWS